jgi:hypothetical protein
MSPFYCDTSALVKRYLSEAGSGWIATLTDPNSNNSITVAAITRVEAAAAIAARQRAGTITHEERGRLVALLLLHFDSEYIVVPVSDVVVEQAVQLTQRHRLRGYDAVQLAAALDANATTVAAGLPTLTFVAADDDLLAAARAEGLDADNPNLRP